MRTRSSRFWVILLHVAGVSQWGGWRGMEKSNLSSVNEQPHHQHHHRQQPHHRARSSSRGFVQPTSIQLETINLLSDDHQRHILASSGRHRTRPEPIWLKDADDDLCLGPTSTFSACGDATLWFVHKPPALRRKRVLWSGLLDIFEDEEWKTTPSSSFPSSSSSSLATTTTDWQHMFAFQVVDRDYHIEAAHPRRKRSRPTDHAHRPECLDWQPDRAVDIQPCRRRHPITWKVHEAGVLQAHRERPRHGTRPKPHEVEEPPLCLHRHQITQQAVLAPCPSDRAANGTILEQGDLRLVKFTFTRYRAVAVPTQTWLSSTPSSSTGKPVESNHQRLPDTSIPRSKDLAHSQASDPTMYPELKLPSTLLFASPKKNKRLMIPGERLPYHLLKHSHPILILSENRPGQKLNRPLGSSPSFPSSSAPTHLHSPIAMDDASYKATRIQLHPYIAASKNEIWVDPQTGLEYRTDICRYLGLDRQEHGRHTLMGVGQYRKGYVVKVYGIAFYVSKRDILADPSYVAYASLTPEQLRARPDFFEMLRSRGNVDRTLLLKTNMQLSAETMRSSLQADWKMLTEEAKTLLVDSTMVARPASEAMLKFIKDPNNPNRCSCGQVAPPEYDANPNCCARGTELSFTWLKTGEIEVRMFGHLVEKLDRPDIAEGIFFEYFRTDNPMSPEFCERVVDGFPFLLAPLAQVKGFNIGHQSHDKATKRINPVVKAWENFSSSLRSQSSQFTEWLVKGATDWSVQAGEAAQSMTDWGQSVALDLDQRRKKISDAIMEFFYPERKLVKADEEDESVFVAPAVEYLNESQREVVPVSFFGYQLPRWLVTVPDPAPDEIGPMMIPPTVNTTRKVLLALVHLYLLLLFIVSFPGSRVKFIVRRGSICRELSDSESDEDESYENEQRGAFEDILCSAEARLGRQGRVCSRGSLLVTARNALRPSRPEDNPEEVPVNPLKKKSFSYFL